jgi:ATP-binding cassette subfamily B protein
MQAKKEEKQEMGFRDAKRVLMWYWKLTRKDIHWYYGALIAYGIAAISASSLTVLVLKQIIDQLTSATTPLWTEQITHYVIVFASLLVGQNILFRIADFSLRKYQVPGRARIASYTLKNVQRHSYTFFANSFTGRLISQSKRFEDGFWTLSDIIAFTFWWDSVTLLVMITTLFLISPILAGLFFGCSVILLVITLPGLKKRMNYDSKEGEASSKLTGQFSDIVTNILNIKIFSSFSFEQKIYKRVVDERKEIEDASYKVSNKVIAVQAAFGELMGLIMLVAALWLWSQKLVTAGTVLVVISYSQSLFHMILQFTRSTIKMLQAVANAKEMIEVFEKEPDILDVPDAKTLTVPQGKVSFEAVDFSYGKQDEKVFEDLSFTIAPGEHVGLVGPSGGGKSTITKLLLRFADVTGGAIAIDGQDIRRVTQDSLRQQVAYVPQDPTLFHRTLLENIAYGNPEATEEMIFAAAKKAHAHDFISKLPEGYQTEVGERGIKLSGGQRQRIAIARAVLKDAPILIMDEATSALDTQSEHAIREALEEIMPGKTVVMIAHRLSTVEKLDRIIVLGKDGKIAEEGTHQELVAKQGLYATLWNHQVGGFLGEEDEEEHF